MGRSSSTHKSSLVIVALGLAFGAAACVPRGSNMENLYTPVGKFATVDYSVLKAQVLGPKCIGCHSEFDSESGVLANVKAGNPSASSLYTEIANGDMPPGGPMLPAGSLLIVQQYINGLAPQAGHGQEPQPQSPSTGDGSQGFAAVKSAVLGPRCLSCHPTFADESEIRKLVVAGKPEDSSLYKVSADGSMPPGGPALSAEELSAIKTYISGLSEQ